MSQGRVILTAITGFILLLILYQPLPSTIYGTVFGRVTDEDTGKGIANVGVNIHGRGNKSTLTDKDGRYTIKMLKHGKYSIHFNPVYPHCDVSPGETFFIESGTNIEINKVLNLGGSIRGKVYHSDGQTPFPGVSIYTFASFAGSENGMTGDDGSYQLGGAGQLGRLCPADYYYIRADSQIPGIAYQVLTGVEVAKGKETIAPDIIFDLNDCTGVEGTVISSIDGQPLQDVTIIISSMDILEPFTNYQMEMGKIYTNINGYYLLKGLKPGKYEISFLPPMKEGVTFKNYFPLCEFFDGIEINKDKTTRLSVTLNVLNTQ